MNPDTLALGALWYVVFLLSTTCHEAAHALAAKLGGDLTAFHGGQVTLDPLPHIRREPFGMVLFPILSFISGGWMMGWASAPYDPYWSQRHPHRAAWMSLAGPAANFSLAILAALAIHIGILAGALQLPDSINFSRMVDAVNPGAADAIARFLSLMFSLNVLLGTFNLLPIPPLDGFSAVGLFMSEDRARAFEQMGNSIRTYSFIGLLIGWQIFGKLYDPILGLSIKALYPTAHYGN
jgi:Zn-dependent protease